MFESLEQRRHLSVSAATVANTLHVFGDSDANGIQIVSGNSQLYVREYQGVAAGYETIYTVLSSAVNSIKVYGYDGADTIAINDNVSKPATIMGGRGADWIKAGGGTTTAWGHGNWEADISGSHRPSTDDNAADTLVTGSGTGAAILRGQGGYDVFHFNSTQFKYGTPDEASGDAGNDVFHLGGKNAIVAQGWTGNDWFHLYPGNDQMVKVLGQSGADTADFANFGQAVYVSNDGIQKSGSLSDWQNRNHRLDNTTETIRGTNFADLLDLGTAGNLFGLDGNDSLFGSSGRDFVDAGKGNDEVHSGSERDTVFGQDGNDKLYGDNGNDNLDGGEGSDSLWGFDGNDSLFGQGGGDHLYAGAGTNLLVGGAGSDYLHAKNGGWFDMVFGDNLNGSGGTNAYDIAVLDLIPYQGQLKFDNVFGVESVSY